MSRILFGLIAFVVFLFAPQALQAQSRVPHYFPEGIEKVTDPASQYEAYLRVLNVTSSCRSALNDHSYARLMENNPKVEIEVAGKKTVLVFDAWIKSGNNIVFYDFCGQKVITPDEFNVVVKDLEAQVRLAVDKAHDYYDDFEERAVKARARNLGVSEGELRNLLDKPVPRVPQITYRELHQLPRPSKKSDFVPKEVHLGYMEEGILGAAWLNSGVTYDMIQGRLADVVIGEPSVLTHEFTHANTNLQRLPLSDGFDVEMAASIPEMFWPEDKISLSRHGYLHDVREMIRVFFGYNFEQASSEVFLWNYGGNIKIDRAKFNQYSDKLADIKKEMLTFFREKAIPEFYSDPVGWTSLHEKLQDSRGVFRIMMALNYDPTILEGHAKTMVFLETNREKIKRMAHEAFLESGKPSDEGEGDSNLISEISIRNLEKVFGMSREEMMSLARKHGIKPESLKDKSFPQMFKILLSVIEKERGSK